MTKLTNTFATTDTGTNFQAGEPVSEANPVPVSIDPEEPFAPGEPISDTNRLPVTVDPNAVYSAGEPISRDNPLPVTVDPGEATAMGEAISASKRALLLSAGGYALVLGEIVPVLRHLTLSNSVVPESIALGGSVGSLLGYVPEGTTITLHDTDGNRFALNAGAIERGATALDYDAQATTRNIIVRQSNPNATPTTLDTPLQIEVTNVFEQPDLGALTLSVSEINTGSAVVINILGATVGSVIDQAVLPAGLTLNSAARTITGTATAEVNDFAWSLRETLGDSSNSPRTSGGLLVVTTPAQSAAIVLPGSVWAFGASSMAGAQIPTSANGGTDDALTDVVRAIEGLAAGSTEYTTAGVSKTNRPIDYNLTGANAAHKIKNRGVGGSTSGSGGTIVSNMTAASGGFGASDFMVLHQGDNDNSTIFTNAGAAPVVTLAAGFASMRASAGARPFVQVINTQGGRGSTGAASGEPPGGVYALAKAAIYRVLSDLTPGRVFSFHHTLLERSAFTPGDTDDQDVALGFAPRSYMMNDGSHQIAKGYSLQAEKVLLPLIDAWAGGAPFPLRQIVEVTQPAAPAAGDAIGNLVTYGSGGSFALDASNTQTDYAFSATGAITRIGAVPPARDVTWAAVKASKSGRFDKVQPRIGIAERAAAGVSKLVEFDGKCVIGMPNSTLANSNKLTLLFRIRATDQSTLWVPLGGTNQCRVELRTNGTLDVVWRNASGTAIVSKTTAANFTTGSADRWVALCIDLSNPAARVTRLVTWAVPAAATVDSALHATFNGDTTTAHAARLDVPMAIGFSSISATATSVFAKMRLGDVTLWRDFIDFSVQARRDEVSNADGTPKAAWVSGGGVTDGKTPTMRLAGNAADFRLCRLTGSSAPATPGAAGQYLGFNNQRRADGDWGYLSTVA